MTREGERKEGRGERESPQRERERASSIATSRRCPLTVASPCGTTRPSKIEGPDKVSSTLIPHQWRFSTSCGSGLGRELTHMYMYM